MYSIIYYIFLLLFHHDFVFHAIYIFRKFLLLLLTKINVQLNVVKLYFFYTKNFFYHKTCHYIYEKQ